MLRPICEGYEKGEGKPCIRYLKGGFCTLPMIFRCTERLRNNEPVLSYSSMKDFVCPRRFYWSYISGLEVIEKALPLTMGTVMDKILRHVHSDQPYSIHQLIDPSMTTKDDLPDLKPWQWAIWGLTLGYIEKGYGEVKGNPQVEFRWMEEGYPQVHGYVDLVSTYEDHIAYEFKYTGRPDSYTKFTVSQQLATYFLGIPRLQRVTLRAIQVPQLKQGAKETGEQYRDRVKLDFVSRPAHYVNDTSYWKTEFDLDEIKQRARRISQSIHSFINEGGQSPSAFYQMIGPETCFAGQGRCNYLEICSSGVVSETIYKKRGGERT
jgi:hypothetical protein